jgi:prevent-host-death family protein
MLNINIHEAKAKLSEYLAAVEAGETVQICRRNVPVAQIVPLPKAGTQPRAIGLGPGGPDYEIPDEFWEPLPDDLMKYFLGEMPDPLLENPDRDDPLLKVAEPANPYGK